MRICLAAFRSQAWDEARTLAGRCTQAAQVLHLEGLDRLYGSYLARIEKFRQVSPGASWDGVFEPEGK